MHKEDLKRVAPLWLKFSKAVRHDPDVSLPVFLGPYISLTMFTVPCGHHAEQMLLQLYSSSLHKYEGSNLST